MTDQNPKRGAIPSPRHILASATPHSHLVGAPPNLIIAPKKISMWGNDVHGDCVTAEEAFAKACNSPEIFIPDNDVIAWATRHNVLEGAYLYQVMDMMQNDGFVESSSIYDDGPYFSVNWTNASILQSAISQGPVKIAVAGDQILSSWNHNNRKTGWFGIGFHADSHFDHCVSLCGYGTLSWLAQQLHVSIPAGIDGSKPGYAMFTWNSIGIIDVPSLLAVTCEAWLRQPTTVTKTKSIKPVYLQAMEQTDNCPHVFGIGTDNTLYLNWRNKSGQWSGWMANWNNAPKLSSVFAMEQTDNCPHVFGIGTDNTLYLNWRNKSGQWSGWMANWNNAPKLSSVFAMEQTDNCPHVFGIGTDHTLYLNWRNPSGQWSGWMANWNNAPKLSSVFAMEQTDNCPHLFGIGTDNTLCLNWRNSSGQWSGWMANWNNAPKLSSVFAMEQTDNCPHIFGIGTDNTLYLNWRNKSGQWSGWMANWA